MLKSSNTNKIPGSDVLRINSNFGGGKTAHFLHKVKSRVRKGRKGTFKVKPSFSQPVFKAYVQ